MSNQKQIESQSDRGQVTRSAAQVYEDFFVPALFQEWTVRVADAAQVGPRQHVLDVACGTGVLARSVAERIGADGSVMGLDVNEGMLDVARQKAPSIDWRQGRAESLPFEGASFDAVVSQFGLMFFEDKRTALREMRRVLKPGGRMAVAVWDSLEKMPGYASLADLLSRLFGDGVADALRAPFGLGDRNQLSALFSDAGMSDVHISTHRGTARFPSIESWMYTEVKGWTFADRLDDAQYARLLDEAFQVLRPFVRADGSVEFDSSAHIAVAG